MFRALLKYAYAPAFMVGFLGAALYLIGAGAPKWTLPLLLLVAILVSFASERVAPYEESWNQDKGDSATNLAHAIVNEASIFLSVLALPLLVHHLPGFSIWPDHWPLWLQLFVAVMIADFGITMAHLASHRFELLWRLHAVHHAAPRLYGFNGLMKHPLHQAIELAAGVTPLLLMGITTDVAWLLSFTVGVQLLLQHSNVDMKIGPLIHVWAVAPAHRHHHLASKTRGDVNFALFSTVWDKMLGTFVANRPSPREGDVGVAGRPDFPRGYLQHIADPFRRIR